MPIVLKNSANADASYGMHRVDNNRSVYHGAEHSDLKKDQLILLAQEPTAASDTYGNRRASVRYIRTTSTTTPGDKVAQRDVKAEIAFSIPVGATETDILEVLARLKSLSDSPEIVTELARKGKVQF